MDNGRDEDEDLLSMAQRHVIEAEEHVARQNALIKDLERDTHAKAAEQARVVLRTLQQSLELARDHLRRERIRRGMGP